MKPCYLDHNAGEPLSDRVTATLADLNAAPMGNPNSMHALGIRARRHVENARDTLAKATGTQPSELVFTSGGSAANASIVAHTIMSHLAQGTRPTLVYGVTEHPSLLDPILQFAALGLCEARPLDVGQDGQPDLDMLTHLASESDALFLMAANNETGVFHDLERISQVVEQAKITWHCDTVQLLGKHPLNFGASSLRGITTAVFSAHKIGGPSGCGALVVRNRAPQSLEVLRTRKSANMMGLVGFASAASDLDARLNRIAFMEGLRSKLEDALLGRYPNAIIHGKTTNRLPNTTAISLQNAEGWIDGEDTVLSLAEAGFCVSTGAACSTGSGEPSHVLQAMGLSAETASASLRISLGPNTTKCEIDAFIDALAGVVEPERQTL